MSRSVRTLSLYVAIVLGGFLMWAPVTKRWILSTLYRVFSRAVLRSKRTSSFRIFIVITC